MALSLLDGGSDTTSAFLETVVLALASNLNYQKRAFDEIDSVLGSRTPEIDDIEKLPFVKALLKEIHRLRPTASMGLPHSVTQDLFVRQRLCSVNTDRVSFPAIVQGIPYSEGRYDPHQYL